MKIIEKIEIKNFRSFGNKKGTTVQIKAINDLSILSGANDSGKSNVLRALNLFFNKKVNLIDYFNFERDYFKKNNSNEDDVQQEIVTVKIWFNNFRNKDRNKKISKQIYLPEKFWVARLWKKTDIHTNYAQKDSTVTDLKRENQLKYKSLVNSKRKEGNFKNQLTKFLDSIEYYYIPAIKDNEYYSHLYGRLQITLWNFKNSKVEQKKNAFETAIQDETNILMKDFESSVNKFLPKYARINSTFEMPKDLINFFNPN